MKKCSFCDYSCRTKREELVCTKKLLYVEDLEECPCGDFTIKLDVKNALIVVGVAVVIISVLVAL